jgi:uncharacterized membrane protein YkoI
VLTRGKVLKLEKVIENGTTTYEAQISNKAGKKSEVQVDASGKPVK